MGDLEGVKTWMEGKKGSSPNRVGKKGENDSIAQAQGGIPPGAGQPRREKSGVP
ncbi:MAG: hypothetical protein HXY45_09675, partial [Syntrophaceae bacterium]|nr:hypothetical protein [Syntrophaceae bacterium]